MRLLIYSQDGYGLGHLRRTGNVARRLLAHRPDATVLTVADSRAMPVFPPHPGMDYLKLPTIVKTGRSSSEASSWQPASLPLAIHEAVRLRTALLVHTLEEFQPDVVLVDHMPVGALGELKPLLDLARGAARRPRLFLGLRDVIDAPDVVRRSWQALGAYDYLSVYDGVLVYGCRDVYDAEQAYALGLHAQKVVFCNYVGPPAAAQHAPLGDEPPADEPFVLVMGGGGGDAYPLAATFLDSVPLLMRERRLRAVVLTGPNMPAEQRIALAERCDGERVTVQSSRDDVPALLARADVVLTMAGYNSLCEVLAARKRALVVPRGGPSAEQRMRGQLFADRSLVSVLDPDELTPERLAERLLALLVEPGLGDERRWIPLDGAERAAQLLLEGGRLAVPLQIVRPEGLRARREG